MPLYEYECESCTKRFERIQKFSDPLADTCPSCGGPVRKLLSSPAIQFKGAGWYITDYARKGAGSEAKADSDKPTEKPAGGDKAADAGTSSSDSSAPKGDKPASTPSTEN